MRRRILGRHNLLIGRHDDCEIFLDDFKASRRHAQIKFVDDQYRIEDLGSSNGTFVNEQKLDVETVLREGDLIRIGGYRIKFEVEVDVEEDITEKDSEDGTTIIRPGHMRTVTSDLDTQLQEATSIQQSLIPTRYPRVGGLEFFHFYLPMKIVGGDFFDYIELPDDRFVILVADTVGHGYAAAVLMSRFSAETRYAFAQNKDPIAAVESLNNSIAKLAINIFVTAIFAVVDLKNFEVELIGAGHPAPVIVSPVFDTGLAENAESNLPIGVAENQKYQSSKIKLAPGERLVFYTDGTAGAERRERP